MTKAKNKSVNILRGAIFIFISSVGVSLLRIIFISILARLISPEDFGLMATASIVTGFADLFVQFGFGQALIQKKIVTQKDIETAYICSLGLGFIFAIIIFISAESISKFFEQNELKTILNILIFLFPIKSFNQVQFSILQKEMRFETLAGKDIISYFIGFGCVGITLAYFGFGVYSLVFALLIQSIVYTILLFVNNNTYKVRFGFSKISFDELFHFSKNLTLSRIFNYMALKGDYFIVGKMLGASALGYYSRAYTLMDASNSIISKVIRTVLFPVFSKNQDNKELLTSQLIKNIKYVFYVGFPISFFLALYSREIVLILLGDEWIDVILPFRILIAVLSFRIGYKILAALAKGTGRITSVVRIQFIYLIAVIFATYFGSQNGIEYVAFVISISIVLVFFLFFILGLQLTAITYKVLFMILIKSTTLGVIINLPSVLTTYFIISSLTNNIIVILVFASIIFLISILVVFQSNFLSNYLDFIDLKKDLFNLGSNIKQSNR